MELTACCACMQALSCKPPFSNYKDSPNISKGNYLLHCPWIRGPNIYSGLLKGSINYVWGFNYCMVELTWLELGCMLGKVDL